MEQAFFLARRLRGEGWKIPWEMLTANQRRPWIEMARTFLTAQAEYKREHSMTSKIQRKLVDDWRSAWRWWSMQLHVIGTSLVALFLLLPSMPREIQALIPVKWQAVAVAVWFALGVIARLWKQKGA